MQTFKEYHAQKELQERVFTTAKGWDREYPIYLNPTIGDLESLNKVTPYVRGFNKGQYVFVWTASEAKHQDTSHSLEVFDPDLANIPTDICFYLTREKQSPVKFKLTYSGFSGQSRETSKSNVHLKRLLEIPGFANIKAHLSNLDQILNSIGDYNPDIGPVASVPASIAKWQQTGANNPYAWKSGDERVGD